MLAMKYWNIDIFNIFYEPNKEPVAKSHQEQFKSYIKAFNRRVKFNEELTDDKLYKYFKSRM